MKTINYVCSKCGASVVSDKVLASKKNEPVCPECQDKEHDDKKKAGK